MLMRPYVVPAVLAASAIYAAVAVLTYLLHFAAYPVALSEALVPCLGVVFPYGVLGAVHRSAQDQFGRRVAWISVAVAALLGAVAYGDSFRARTVPDMYSLLYVAVPVLQIALAAVALVTVFWRRRSRGGRVGA
jgi:hypothetical protein